MTVLDKARQVLDEGPICDSCLGRRFGLLSYGLTSRERGHALRVTLSLEDDTDFEGEPDDCWVCDGFFDEESLERWAERVVESLEGYGFETYQVGTRVPPLVEENENLLDDLVGDEHAQGFSTDFNREVGKRVGELLKEERSNAPEVGFDRPDVVAVVDLTEEAVDLQVNPLHVYGRYRKLERDVPQTEWPCRDCDGTGEKGGEECDHCGGTGYMYEESVEELIRPAVLDAFGGDGMVFHGAGREDVDALMLGDGRPFVAEVKEPRKRTYDLERLASEVNESAKGKVEVGELKLVSPDMVERVKQLDASKRYRMTVELSKEVSGEELEDALC
ncbi:MAG: tRNA pseudouridine(54/55) synthase Pus10, partial [Halobacteria archaeon]|nr:tRNA pseudouridine(54/55) synthase Pus10 [Halobacteria archaeon]